MRLPCFLAARLSFGKLALENLSLIQLMPVQLRFLKLCRKLTLPDQLQEEKEGQLHLYPRTSEQLFSTLDTCRASTVPFSVCPFGVHSPVCVHLCRLSPFGYHEDGLFRCNFAFQPRPGDERKLLFPLSFFSRSFLLSFYLLPFANARQFYFLEVTGVDQQGKVKKLYPYRAQTFQNQLTFFPVEGVLSFHLPEETICGVFDSLDQAWQCGRFLFKEELVEGFSIYPPSITFPFGFGDDDEWVVLFSVARKGSALPPLDILDTIALSYGGYLARINGANLRQTASRDMVFFFCPAELLITLDAQIKNMTLPLSSASPVQGLALVNANVFLLWYLFMFRRELVGSQQQAIRSIMNTGEYLGAQAFSPVLPRACRAICSII